MRIKALAMAALLFLTAIVPAFAAYASRDFIVLQNGTRGQVVEVIDVNAIRVRTSAGDGLVRLIGVHSNGTSSAIDFLSREIMGTNVVLMRDAAFANSGRWNYMYVVLEHPAGARFINGELVLSGHGRLNEAHSRAEHFEQIRLGQTIARDAGLGMWGNELSEPLITYARLRINMNTATAAEMVAHFELTGADVAIATAIVNFRNSTVFQHVNDIKFVPAVTRDFFERHSRGMAVSTNINAASLEEIRSLAGVNESQAQAIINSRDGQRFTDLEQLFTRNLMTRPQLNANLPFISLESIDRIHFARPQNFIANINTASAPQLTRTGLPIMQANTIIAQREFMPLRNLHDLRNFGGVFADASMNMRADNLRAFTNINTAPMSEIESLFGTNVTTALVNSIINNRPFDNINQIAQFMSTAMFNSISPFIYVGERPALVLVNINTANYQQLIGAGFPSDVALRLVGTNVIGATTATRPPLWRPNQLPAWITTDLRQISTLYTNINTATAEELRSLDAGMSYAIVDRLIAARDAQPFGDVAEVEEYFREMGQLALFNRFRNFVIVR